MLKTILVAASTLAACSIPPATDPVPGYQGRAAYPAPATAPAPAQAQPQAQAARRVTFNGNALDASGWEIITQLEARTGHRLGDGDYWYDPACGAAGAWGGPALAIIPAGLPLGGRLPAAASGGGDGRLTGVFINGRELHPIDVQGLAQLTGQYPLPGRYWVDAYGNAGYEGGPALVNLVALSRQRGGGKGYFRANTGGTYIGSDGQSSYFFDGATGCSVMDGSVSC